MKILFLILIGIFTNQFLFAQGVISDGKRPPILQKLHVNQDPRLDKMLNWHIVNNKKIDGVDGYRVEIFFNSESDALEKAKIKKVEFLTKFPDYIVHIKYDAPNFKVRVGDFRTKNEALKLQKKIDNYYPMAFIVPDKIIFPLLKQVDYE